MRGQAVERPWRQEEKGTRKPLRRQTGVRVFLICSRLTRCRTIPPQRTSRPTSRSIWTMSSTMRCTATAAPQACLAKRRIVGTLSLRLSTRRPRRPRSSASCRRLAIHGGREVARWSRRLRRTTPPRVELAGGLAARNAPPREARRAPPKRARRRARTQDIGPTTTATLVGVTARRGRRRKPSRRWPCSIWRRSRRTPSLPRKRGRSCERPGRMSKRQPRWQR
mmetsp:Transcript_3289/g.8369  ORF Transcript_3289/g.8369 Transcript_3289/m.8369 type:complete len:223 (+) Transcript_3289:48-716(+)